MKTRFALALSVVAGVLWLILKDMEKKIGEAIGEGKRARRS